MSVGDLVSEMAKVYREARQGELEVEKATKLVYMPSQMRSALEVAALEERIAALEGKQL